MPLYCICGIIDITLTLKHTTSDVVILISARSAWSRTKKLVMEISDFNKKESIEYLIKKRNIKKVDAEKLYDLVGGRIVDLNNVADDFKAGQKFEGRN